MSLWDAFLDSVKPQPYKDVENIYKVGKAVDKFEKGSNLKNVESMQSILKKGWIEKAEKSIKAEIKTLEKAVKSSPDWPDSKIDAQEAKVFAAYKKESKKGLEPVDCKKTQAEIRKLLKTITAHQKELKGIVSVSSKSISTVQGWASEHGAKKAYAGKLEASFKTLTKSSFLLSSVQAEMLTYFLHCRELKKLYSEAESLCKKLAKCILDEATDAKGRIDMAKEQYTYTSRSCYWDDLPMRI